MDYFVTQNAFYDVAVHNEITMTKINKFESGLSGVNGLLPCFVLCSKLQVCRRKGSGNTLYILTEVLY